MSDVLKSDFVCRIDASNTIVAAGHNWSDLLRNNPPANDTPPYIGKRLWSHLGNSTVVHLFQALAAKARRAGETLSVPFRGDSAGKPRLLEIHVVPLPAGAVEFQSVLIREEPRVMTTSFVAPPAYSAEFIRMCGWCKRVAAPEWVEVEVAIRRLKLLEAEEIRRVTHSICPECAAEVMKQMESDNQPE